MLVQKKPISPKGALFTNTNSPPKRGLYPRSTPCFTRTAEIPPGANRSVQQIVFDCMT
jgi:hypothetical protein